jgi:O-acetyl-ADP-ribose deacetylase (regulator of RNase III)
MIESKIGDILQADAEALVNTVNCVGIMGRGIALQFKLAFPENFKAYEAACARDEVRPGRMFVFETGFLANPKYVINFPTKRHWRDKSRIEDIDAGLKALVDEIRRRGIRSIAVPPLGSGLGGLDWAEVRPIIEAALGNLDLQAVVFEPHASADPRPVKRSAKLLNMTKSEEKLDRGGLIPLA